MIPETITRAHVIEALQQIDITGVPEDRRSIDFDLVHEAKRYPPKFVIAAALQVAAGTVLSPNQYTSHESNTVLKKLGFEVVRRIRPADVGPESPLEVAQAVFERLVPDTGTRKVIAEIFAQAIEQAHTAGEMRWELTLTNDLVRLNGGRVLMFDVKAENAFVSIDAAEVDEDTRHRLDEIGERRSPFAVLPTFECYRVPHALLVELWPKLRAGFRRSVAEAVLTARRCVWLRYHSPGAVEYIASVVGRALPQPMTETTTEEVARPNERGIYWVNQGKGVDDDSFLFARKKDAGGATPAHWARLKDLVPGDLVVHYAGGLIRAISRVRVAATDYHRTVEPAGDGWRVEVETWKLPTSLEIGLVFGGGKGGLDVGIDAERGPFDKHRKVKQGYLWEFSEEGLNTIRAASPDKEAWPAWTKSVRSRSWMFHANPDLFDVRGAVQALPELNWTVRQHQGEMRVGDTVFLWQSGPSGGIVAIARIITEPGIANNDPAEASFRKPGLKVDPTDPVVRLAIERALHPIIEADDMRADPNLVTLPAFTSPQRTNSAVSPAQSAILMRWAAGERPPRVVKIALGEKGSLWEECLAGGFACVGWDEVGDLRQYEDWSSFRKAFGATCELGKIRGHVTIKAHELWVLAKLKPGDKIVANKGISRVLGVGTVKEPGYVWDETRNWFKHTVRVDWDESVACEIPPYKHWGVSTVDKVPANVVALVLPELAVFASADAADGAVGAGATGQVKPSAAPPPASPFASLVQSLQSKESQLWFSDELVAHYILALQSKRFAILTGVSGTGKTQLALAVAKHFQPRTRRVILHPPPDGAVVKRVVASMRHGSLILPASIGAGMHLGGLQGTGSTIIDVEYPEGVAELNCYRDFRSSSSSVYHLSLKGAFREWIQSFGVGEELFIERLDANAEGRDRLRFSLPTRHEEISTLKNYEVIAVRPDWTDSRGLLGFFNPLTRRYSTTPFLRLLLEADAEGRRATAENRPPSPFFAILDEMNLARVEQYFAEFLSALETGEPVHLHDDAAVEAGESDDVDDDDVIPIPRSVKIPSNLFFTGTVNVDETTYMFSPKVLDRAFVLEFNEVDLDGYGTRDLDTEENCALALENWRGFAPFRGVTASDWDALAKVDGGDIRSSLARIHDILAEDNRHFGYRVANEIGRFISLAREQAADPKQASLDALDLAVVSKILPKLHGTQQELEDVLTRLFCFTIGEKRPNEHDAWQPSGGELRFRSEKETEHEPWLRRSSLKLWRMLRRLRAQGFTSFIE